MVLLLAAIALMPPSLVSQEITFKTPDGLELHGTLEEPSGQGKFKAVLFLSGSGPTDRDGNQTGLESNLLKEMAVGLANAGIASLRFDKRAAHSNSAIWPTDPSKFDDFFSWPNQVADAGAALDALRNRPEIDGAHVAVAGHSEGGLITLTLGSQLGADKLPALALLDGPGRPLRKILEEQIQAVLDHQTKDPAVKEKYMTNLRESLDFVEKTGTRPSNVLPGLAALFGPGTGKYWQSVLEDDPAKLLEGYGGNVLIVQGEMDNQVSVVRDLTPLKNTAMHRPKGKLEVVIVPYASHNLKQVSSIDDEGLKGPVIPGAIQAFTEWAAKNL